MKYKKLKKYLKNIEKCPLFDNSDSKCTCIPKFPPVINELRPTQKYLIISSDPSGDTDKTKDASVPHSDFAIRFLSLIFNGSDDDNDVEIIKKNYSKYNEAFLRDFYWTHFNKCFADGNPNSICAKEYLKNEISLFEPKLIIILGLKPASFLLGTKSLKDYVNKTLFYGDIKTFVSLHPSRNWNLNRRPQYDFNETWDLIRKNLKL